MATVTFRGVGKSYLHGSRAVSPVDLTIEDGEFMVLIGPSGCGKTTMLRMVAGLEDITEGEIRIDGVLVNNLAPGKRDVAMVFQNYALYPHMNVYDNLAFPISGGKHSKVDVRERVQAVAKLLGLDGLLRRRPGTLSGGQRQRVAIGRALVREPKVFLMDEPLSNLDTKLRTQMRSEIRKLQKEVGVTTLYVTHDQVEAMTMGSRIAVMRKGVLQQCGTPQTLYDRPANLFVATFLGSPSMNIVRGAIEPGGDGLSCVVGAHRFALPPSVLTARPALAGYNGRSVAVGIRPEDLCHPSVGGAGWARLVGQVELIEALGAQNIVHLQVEAEPVVSDQLIEVASDLDPGGAEPLVVGSEPYRVPVAAVMTAGQPVKEGTGTELLADPDKLHFFDLGSGAAIAGDEP